MSRRLKLEDLVSATGLSRATIDRVIHGRPGVRSETKDRVQAALLELGYAPNALSMMASHSKAQVQVFVSSGANPFFERLRAGLDRAIAHRRNDVATIEVEGFDPYDPSTLVNCLRSVDAATTSVALVGVDCVEVTQAIDELVARQVHVVTFVSDVPNSNRAAYVGQDNFFAGKTAGRMMADLTSSGPGTVAVLLGHQQFRHLLERRSGFHQTLGGRRPELSVVYTEPYGTCPDTATTIIEDLFADHPALVGLYLCGGGQPHLIDALLELKKPKPIIIGHEVNRKTRDALLKEVMNLVIAHDVFEVGSKAIDAAVDKSMHNYVPCAANIYVAENLPTDWK